MTFLMGMEVQFQKSKDSELDNDYREIEVEAKDFDEAESLAFKELGVQLKDYHYWGALTDDVSVLVDGEWKYYYDVFPDGQD